MEHDATSQRRNSSGIDEEVEGLICNHWPVEQERFADAFEKRRNNLLDYVQGYHLTCSGGPLQKQHSVTRRFGLIQTKCEKAQIKSAQEAIDLGSALVVIVNEIRDILGHLMEKAKPVLEHTLGPTKVLHLSSSELNNDLVCQLMQVPVALNCYRCQQLAESRDKSFTPYFWTTDLKILCSELLWKEAIAERQASQFTVPGIHLFEKASKNATISTEQSALAVTQHFNSLVSTRAPSLPGHQEKTANASAQAPSLIPAVDNLSPDAVSVDDTATRMTNTVRLDSVHSMITL